MAKASAFVEACQEEFMPQLMGLTITGGVVDGSGEYWAFSAEGKQNGKPVKKLVFVLADPEGNGPGWLSIQEE